MLKKDEKKTDRQVATDLIGSLPAKEEPPKQEEEGSAEGDQKEKK